MSILKKQDVANDMLIRSVLAYHLLEKKTTLKNYWLRKREIKEQTKEHDDKLDEIARFVTKYIGSKKSQDKG